MTQRKQVTISESIGAVSIKEIIPADYKAMLVLAHGAGAGMEHAFMENLAMHLATHGIATIRYNFPYMEKGKRRPDVPAVAEKTVRVVMDWVHQQYTQAPLFVGGKSFGGRMSSQCLAKDCPSYINGIIFFGFPLHAIGKESTDRADHLKSIQIPMLFLQGTKDKLARQDLIEQVCSRLPMATLNIIEGADHSFKVPKKIADPDLPGMAANWIIDQLAG